MKFETISIKGMIYAAMFGAATAVGALITIPLPFVPITLQTLFVYLSGALLGARLGALSQFVYILLGIMGLPVFSRGQAGLGVLFGPTGGYLIGFIVAAFVIGLIVQLKKNPSMFWIGFAMMIGTIFIYTFGVIQLSIIAKFTLLKAINAGALPFLLGDALKIIIAVLIVMKIRDKIKI